MLTCYILGSVFSSRTLMASALMNHWVVGHSSHREYASNRSDGCLKILTRNYNGVKGKKFMPTEKVTSTGWQITRAVPKDPKKVISIVIRNYL